MATKINCPKCGKLIPESRAQPDGTDLIFRCSTPGCKGFIVQRQKNQKPKNWNVQNPVQKRQKQRR